MHTVSCTNTDSSRLIYSTATGANKLKSLKYSAHYKIVLTAVNQGPSLSSLVLPDMKIVLFAWLRTSI